MIGRRRRRLWSLETRNETRERKKERVKKKSFSFPDIFPQKLLKGKYELYRHVHRHFLSHIDDLLRFRRREGEGKTFFRFFPSPPSIFPVCHDETLIINAFMYTHICIVYVCIRAPQRFPRRRWRTSCFLGP